MKKRTANARKSAKKNNDDGLYGTGSGVMSPVLFIGLPEDYSAGRSRISRIAAIMPGVATTPFRIFHK
jgi:hypothetical protein